MGLLHEIVSFLSPEMPKEELENHFRGISGGTRHALGESDDSQNLFQGRVSEMIPGITKFHLGKPLLASMQKNSNGGDYFENTV